MANQKREYDKITIENIQDKCFDLRNKNYSYGDIAKHLRREYKIDRTPETISLWVKNAGERAYKKENYGNLIVQTMRGAGEFSDLLRDIDELLSKKYIVYHDINDAGKEYVQRKNLSQRAIVDLLHLKSTLLEKMNTLRGINNTKIQMELLKKQQYEVGVNEEDFKNLDTEVLNKLKNIFSESDKAASSHIFI